ncbi:MFS transporter [Streptomyces phaeolivaceus]|uniref:MFS transporter n=2 Tax=Streptomyces phaeolivaceus TaxID=2653200 RepID=A0A5P8KGF3_9ACTN|nr:MFS transporter [Streptomyces phaeolivaceus]
MESPVDWTVPADVPTRIGEPALLPLVEAVARAGPPEAVRRAQWTPAGLAVAEPGVYGPLLKHPHASVRVTALSAFQRGGESSAGFLDLLVPSLGDPDADVRRRAVAVFRAIGCAAVPVLRRWRRRPATGPRIRSGALEALALGAVLLLFGAAFGGINVAFNSAAVDLVAALGRPIMSSFHAAFSLGGMVGAGLGSLVAGSLSPTRHLLGITLVGLLVTALAAPTLLRHGPPAPPAGIPEPGAAESGTARPATRRLDGRTRGLMVVLGVIAGCTAYGEGALADWGALHLEADLDTSPGAAAIGYTCFALAMTIGRLTGTTLIERLGRTAVLVAGGATATAGMLLGSLAPSVWATLLGFAVTGLGLANIFPVAIERAGAPAGPGGVATASTLGYLGMLLGSPAIGFMAEWFSLPVALTSVAVLTAFASVIAFATRHSTAK